MRLRQVKILSRALAAAAVLIIIVGMVLETVEIMLLSLLPWAALFAVTCKFWRCPHGGQKLDDNDLI